MSEAERLAIQLELEEKYLKIANLQADTTLKQLQGRFEPWKVVVSGMAAGGALVGATAAAALLLLRSGGRG